MLWTYFWLKCYKRSLASALGWSTNLLVISRICLAQFLLHLRLKTFLTICGISLTGVGVAIGVWSRKGVLFWTACHEVLWVIHHLISLTGDLFTTHLLLSKSSEPDNPPPRPKEPPFPAPARPKEPAYPATAALPKTSAKQPPVKRPREPDHPPPGPPLSNFEKARRQQAKVLEEQREHRRVWEEQRAKASASSAGSSTDRPKFIFRGPGQNVCSYRPLFPAERVQLSTFVSSNPTYLQACSERYNHGSKDWPATSRKGGIGY